jgi:uncharacterized protein YbjT (DUF2867 family)
MEREKKTPGRILVAGGSGFVGRGIVLRLLEEGYEVAVLSRRPSTKPIPRRGALTVVTGSALDPETLRGAMEGFRAVVNAIGIIMEKPMRGITYERLHIEATHNLLDEAERCGIGRFIQISALGTRPDGISRYQTTKYAAEEEVKSRMRRWTIFRPSLVIGPGGGFVSVIRPLARLPVAPVFGNGLYSFEPIDRRVLARAVAVALESDSTCGGLYELRGPKAYTYNEILDEMGKTLGKRRVRKVHLPLWFVRPLVFATGWLPFSPVNRDQLEMLLESKPGRGRDGVAELGLPVIDLPEALEHAIGTAEDG